MKDIAIQLVDHTDDGEVMDLKIEPVKDSLGLITQGVVINSTLEQNKALLLIANPGDIKSSPTIGAGVADIVLGDDLLEYRHRIRETFKSDGLKIKTLDFYNLDNINIEASYE